MNLDSNLSGYRAQDRAQISLVPEEGQRDPGGTDDLHMDENTTQEQFLNERVAPGLGRLLYSVKEVTKALSISSTTLRHITRQGDLPCVQIGRRTLYRREDLEAFVDRLVEPTYRR